MRYSNNYSTLNYSLILDKNENWDLFEKKMIALFVRVILFIFIYIFIMFFTLTRRVPSDKNFISRICET